MTSDDGTAAPIPPELAIHIEDAIRAAVSQDSGGVSRALHELADYEFPAGIAFACYTWARMAASAMVGSPQKLQEYQAGGMAAGIQFATDDGRMVNAEDAPPTVRFVGRMIACALNGDHHAAIDLWATLPDDQWADCTVEMVDFAARMIHARARSGIAGGPGTVR